MASSGLNFLAVALVAQWIEQEPSNLLVAGSIPAEGANEQRESISPAAEVGALRLRTVCREGSNFHQ